MIRRSVRVPMFSILMVCTGNICRSPFAERMLRLRASDNPQIEVYSAGLHAVVGAPMEKMAAKQLTAHGGNPDKFHATQIDFEQVCASNIILTMTRAQRDELIRLYPAAMRRTFVLAELAKALLAHPSSTFSNCIEIAARDRAALKITSVDDVLDPINADESVHESVAAQISSLVDIIAPRLDNMI